MRWALLLIVVAFVALPATALGGNSADQRLDAAASEVAGKPVPVWCENSWADWIHFGDSVSQDWTWVSGFTVPSAGPTVYVNPRQCETLHALLNGENVGTYYAASALLTLAHESVHQRGVLNEGETDCTALPLVPGLAVSRFGIASMVSQSYTATTVRRFVRKVRGKRVVIRVVQRVVRWRTVKNPYLDRLAADALRWHRSKPPEYQGNC